LIADSLGITATLVAMISFNLTQVEQGIMAILLIVFSVYRILIIHENYKSKKFDNEMKKIDALRKQEKFDNEHKH